MYETFLTGLSRLIILGSGAGLAVAVVLLAARFAPVPGRVEAGPCTLVTALTPQTEPGPFWVRHRYSLRADPAGLGTFGPAILLNLRTREAFRADDQDDRAEGVFGVRTRYALLINRRWNRDPWVLCLLNRASAGRRPSPAT